MVPRHILLACLAACATGCTTVYSEGQVDEEAQMQASVQNLQRQVTRLQEKVDDMDAERQDLYNRLEVLEAGALAARQEQQTRIAALERGVGALDQARVKDREEIVTKVADIVRTTGGSSSSRSGAGYEHVVQPGETLSAIAAAYKAKPAAIIEANSLKNPNSLRVGQKLFIPE